MQVPLPPTHYTYEGEINNMPFLDQWFDPTVPTAEDPNWEAYAQEQANRTMRLAIIASHATDMKRRLGQDANRHEIAADKKLSRGLATHWRQFAEQWGATEEEIDDYATAHHEELARLGAQVDWAKEIEEHTKYLQRQLALVATTCLKNEDTKTGNRLCNRLFNEVNVVGNAYKRYIERSSKTD